MNLRFDFLTSDYIAVYMEIFVTVIERDWSQVLVVIAIELVCE